MMAQEELKKITERTHRGLKGRVTKKGALLPGRRPLYGYHWQDREMEWEGQMITVPKAQYVVFEPEAKVVRYMFELALERTPIRRIGTIFSGVNELLTEKCPGDRQPYMGCFDTKHIQVVLSHGNIILSMCLDRVSSVHSTMRKNGYLSRMAVYPH